MVCSLLSENGLSARVCDSPLVCQAVQRAYLEMVTPILKSQCPVVFARGKGLKKDLSGNVETCRATW